jgi:hypothetical protein
MEVFLKGEYRLTQRSAWPLALCAEHHPALVKPWLSRMISRMQEPGVHDAVRRNVLRTLQSVDIPSPLLGRVAAACFGYLTSHEAPIAVKVFSMTVLGRISVKKPDLGRELRLVIEQQLPYAGPGFRARAKQVLPLLPSTTDPRRT